MKRMLMMTAAVMIAAGAFAQECTGEACAAKPAPAGKAQVCPAKDACPKKDGKCAAEGKACKKACACGEACACAQKGPRGPQMRDGQRKGPEGRGMRGPKENAGTPAERAARLRARAADLEKMAADIEAGKAPERPMPRGKTPKAPEAPVED